MPKYTMQPEMSPIHETNKFLVNSTFAAQDGSISGRDDATRRDSIFPSEIDGGEEQHTQTPFGPFDTDYKTSARDKPKTKTKRPAGIENILRGPAVHKPNLNRTF